MSVKNRRSGRAAAISSEVVESARAPDALENGPLPAPAAGDGALVAAERRVVESFPAGLQAARERMQALLDTDPSLREYFAAPEADSPGSDVLLDRALAGEFGDQAFAERYGHEYAEELKSRLRG
jgi:hypothetical protein